MAARAPRTRNAPRPSPRAPAKARGKAKGNAKGTATGTAQRQARPKKARAKGKPAPSKPKATRRAARGSGAATAAKARPRRPPPTSEPHSLIVLGASAGGIESLRRVLGGVPPGLPASILVVLHRDAEHASLVETVLQRGTSLPVRSPRNGERLVPGAVYVAPQGRHMEVADGHLRLSLAPPVRFSRPSIDRLLESAARVYGERLLVALLSGAGRDGTEGARAVKAAGGFVLAEAPTSASFRDLPDSAVAAGVVDRVLDASAMGPFLAQAVRTGAPEPDMAARDWQYVLDAIQRRSGLDFSGYRPTTLRRRLARRMLATGQRTARGYVRYLRGHPEEVEKLQAAFLIKVSGFFRDDAAWSDLRRLVLRPLARRWRPGRTFRAWSVGCATGEEAYSLAMALHDALPPRARESIRVFATDVDPRALEVAREGTYPSDLVQSLPAPLVRRHFTKDRTRYRVRSHVRRLVIFGRHDVTADPPITNVDLLLCRNVLIYVGKDVKREVLARFAYAVRPDGHLFLGKSESLPAAGSPFRVASPRAHLYRRVASEPATPPPARRRAGPARSVGSDGPLLDGAPDGRAGARARAILEQLLHGASTVLVLGVDRGARITLWNRAAALRFGMASARAMGRPLRECVRGPLGARLDGLARAARVSGAPVVVRGLPLPRGGESHRYDWEAVPLGPLEGKRAEVVMLGVDTPEPARAGGRSRDAMTTLRRVNAEQARANEELAQANEELETLNEELQSTAEEQQTMNEEMQSRNEELETVNEELQSANEELTTLNEEVRVRGDEAERTTRMLRGLLDLTDDMVIVCDDDNRILVWSPTGRRLFHLSEAQALGRDLFQVVPALDVPTFRQTIREVLRVRPNEKRARAIMLADGATRIDLAASSSPPGAGYAFILRIPHPAPDQAGPAPAPEAPHDGARASRKRRTR